MRGANSVRTRMRAKEGRSGMMWVEHVCGACRKHPLRLPCSCVLLSQSAFSYIDVVTSGWKHGCCCQQCGPVPPQPMLCNQCSSTHALPPICSASLASIACLNRCRATRKPCTPTWIGSKARGSSLHPMGLGSGETKDRCVW